MIVQAAPDSACNPISVRALSPPGRRETRAELKKLNDLISRNDANTRRQIAFWDAGAPAYRWIDMINERVLAGAPTTPFPHRVYTYVALATYDATVAAWESKYFYNRRRPSELDHKLPTSAPVPNSPSYPSEHAAAAQAAAAVLAHFLPAEAQSFQTLAEEAGWSRVLAGLQYPSDYHAGLALGRAVAEKVIEKARSDGSDADWTGSVPTGPCKWIGTNPGNVTAANWVPLLLSSPSDFRPAPPPSCDSSLTTIGAKTGQRRTLPVLGLLDGERIVVIASNYGRRRNPSLYHNLRKNPRASVSVEGVAYEVEAHELTGEERERYFRQGVEVYPGFAIYRRWAAGRRIPVIKLDPAS
jgi:deazaflavin-dependent oxidoreductase (nitroreductase family)